jgi:ribonucleoside-diphosphate reductase alpha chain
MATAPTNPMTDTRYHEPTLTENAQKVLEARYLKKNENGDCIESSRELFARVAEAIAAVEMQYGGSEATVHEWRQRFYDLMASGRFQPNSPTLMNAGREMGMLSACFVLPVRDSINEIFDSIKHTALIQKAGGGTGFAFDELRPTGDFIKSSGGTTSGPITFWKAFSEATNAIQQGAFRRGANMGMMYVHHPDILKFLHAKQDLTQFTNYNISVKVTDAWMNALREDADSPQIVRNPRTGQAYVIPRDVDIKSYDIKSLIPVDCVEPVSPGSRECYFTSPVLTAPLPEELAGQVYTKGEIWKVILQNAWQTGEPGVVFIDRINEHNPTPHVGRIEATNPCGEQPLLPYEACNLGSVNLGAFVKSGCTPRAEMDWDALRKTVHDSTRFLDNVIDANNYPLDEIEQVCKANRKIGLGIMGFADALYKLNVAYNSDEGTAWGEKLMKFINDEAHNCSEQLAKQRGCFPNWVGSIWHASGRMMRNAATTTVAPTGTISIIANCSGGVEPMFSLAFLRNVLKGQKQGERPMVEVNDTFRQVARERGFYSEELFKQIAKAGTIAHNEEIPADIRRVFVCAHDITPEWHMKMQAAFQRHCDSSISKTINFPKSASVEDVQSIYEMAFDYGCKGVTVYRDGCRDEQPMSLDDEQDEKKAENAVTETSVANASAIAAQPIERPAGSILPPLIEPADLPMIVSGLRIRQQTPFGNMHVKITVNPRTDRELEVFAQLGKGGDVANSDLEAICRMISLWLRAGGSLRHVIKQLAGIGSTLQIPTKYGKIKSLGDGLACALKQYLNVKRQHGLQALLLGLVDPAAFEQTETPARGRLSNDVNGDVLSHNGKNGNGSNGNGHNPTGPSAPLNGGSQQNQAPAAGGRLNTVVEQRTASSEVAGQQVERQAPQNMINGHANGNGQADHGTWSQTETATALAEPEVDTQIEARLRIDQWLAGETSDSTDIVDFNESAVAGVEIDEDTLSMTDDLYMKQPCPDCGAALAREEGCKKCYSCGFSACG